jgi:hypothetical protein
MGSIQFLESSCCRGALGRFQYHSLSPYTCRSIGNFYDAFVLLCLTPILFTMYRIFVSMYFVTLCQI